MQTNVKCVKQTPMLHNTFSFQCVGEGAVMLYATSGSIESKNRACQQLAQQVKTLPVHPNWFYDLIPSYDSIIIHFDCLTADQHDVYQWLVKLDSSSVVEESCTSLILPICYTLDRENDLAQLSVQTGLQIEEIIRMHSSCEYNVYAIGFAPGFAYMGFVPPALETPRKATPRTKVPKGAVAIADRQTAIYPSQSPGGWNIVGYCPLNLLDMTHQPISPFTVGQNVAFEQINESKFLALEGKPWYRYQSNTL